MLVQMDFRSILIVIFRQIWKFLLVFVPIVLIGLIYALTATKYYKSNAVLLVKFGQDARPEMSIGGGSNLSAEEKRGLVQSNVNILVSRDVAKEVFQEVGIKNVYPDIVEKKFDDATKMEIAIHRFSQNVETHTESNAGTISVGFFDRNPEVANLVLTHLIDVFVETQAEVFGNPQMDVLQEQADQARKKLDDSTAAFNTYKIENGIASIDEELTLLLKQRADLTGYMSRRQAEPPAVPLGDATDAYAGQDENGNTIDQEATEQSAPEHIYSALPAAISADSDGSRLPLIEESQKKIDELRSLESELLLTYKPTSERVSSVRKNIELEKEALEKSVNAINQKIADLNVQIEQRESLRAKYDELSRDVDYNSESLKTAQERLHAAQVNNDLNQRKITRISMIERPTVPLSPSKPKKTLIMILCLLVGGALGAALALGTEFLDSTFSRPEQLKAELKKPVLASFANNTPDAPREWKLPQILMHDKVQKYIHLKPVISFNAPFRAATPEQIKKELATLYHGIERALPSGLPRIVNFSSTHNGEGTTTIAYELARIAATHAGQNVLFVSSEEFMPATGEMLPKPSASLVDIAAGKDSLRNALVMATEQTGGISHAYIQHGDGIEGLIGGLDKIGDVMLELKKNFSLIIVPTPGIISNPVSAILSRSYDGIVFVIEAERTRAPVAKQALNSLDATGQKVLGVVLNKQRHYIPDWLYKKL